jgi:hypothetical protein
MKDAVLTVRLPRRTRARIEEAARREGRSLSRQTELLVETGLAAAGGRPLRSTTRVLANVLDGSLVPDLSEFRAARRELSRSLGTRSHRTP